MLWHRYSRDEAADAVGIEFGGWDRQSGIVRRPGQLVFFVTLDKGEMDEAYQYRDQFLSPTEFQWQSQNRNTQASELGQEIRHQRERGITVHLFVRKQRREGSRTSPFLYCGELGVPEVGGRTADHRVVGAKRAGSGAALA